jgi:hypothetical protein
LNYIFFLDKLYAGSNENEEFLNLLINYFDMDTEDNHKIKNKKKYFLNSETKLFLYKNLTKLINKHFKNNPEVIKKIESINFNSIFELDLSFQFSQIKNYFIKDEINLAEDTINKIKNINMSNDKIKSFKEYLILSLSIKKEIDRILKNISVIEDYNKNQIKLREDFTILDEMRIKFFVDFNKNNKEISDSHINNFSTDFILSTSILLINLIDLFYDKNQFSENSKNIINSPNILIFNIEGNLNELINLQLRLEIKKEKGSLLEKNLDSGINNILSNLIKTFSKYILILPSPLDIKIKNELKTRKPIKKKNIKI